jgi:manganese efflux pump family protein
LIALLFVALAVAIGNFAVAAAFGLARPSRRRQLEIGLVFGLFEGGMPVLGLLLGRQFSTVLGGAARPAGAVLLCLVGGYGLITGIMPPREPGCRGRGLRGRGQHGSDQHGGWSAGRSWRLRLWLSAMALSLDNLVAGLALGAYHVPAVAALCIFAGAGAGLSLLGVELGRRASRLLSRQLTLGGPLPGKKQLSDLGELLASAMLIVVGIVLGLT